MLEYQTLQVIWWLLIGVVIILYATTAGFDFGMTLMLPFFKKENDRRVLLNVSAPTWDGNQTWLVFAGGAVFVIWPVVYGLIFSGLYALMLFILWSFFLRPPGFDYRSKLQNVRWQRFWDAALFVSAFFPVLMFGLIFGNLMVGLPFHFDAFTLRDFYTGNFFQLFNHFSMICAIIALLMALSHGASLLHRRTEGDLKKQCEKNHRLFTLLLLVFMTLAALMVTYSVEGYVLVSSSLHPTDDPLGNVVTRAVGAWTASYALYPWKIIGPLLAYLGLIAALFSTHIGKGACSFWANCVGITGLVLTAGFNLFPFIVPSQTQPNQSLTVWNATSGQYTLQAMLCVSIVIFILVFIYKIFCFTVMWRKQKTLTITDVQENEHTFY